MFFNESIFIIYKMVYGMLSWNHPYGLPSFYEGIESNNLIILVNRQNQSTVNWSSFNSSSKIIHSSVKLNSKIFPARFLFDKYRASSVGATKTSSVPLFSPFVNKEHLCGHSVDNLGTRRLRRKCLFTISPVMVTTMKVVIAMCELFEIKCIC